MKISKLAFASGVFIIGLVVTLAAARSKNSARAEFKLNTNQNLVFEIMDDREFHFAFYEGTPEPTIAHSPMILREKFAGPREFKKSAQGFATAKIEVVVDRGRGCFHVVGRAEICVRGNHALTLEAPQVTNIYGLGEQFAAGGGSDLNWRGRARTPGSEFGNKMVDFEDGAVGNAQFPIVYALDHTDEAFSLLLDNTYAQTWNFQKDPWQISTSSGPLRGYFRSGHTLSELRHALLDLTGRPALLPRKAFGLWVSEYGYDNWQEIEGKLKTLRANHFPIDGFVLDLQWFGNVQKGSATSPMGGLQWDETHFPEAARKIQEFLKDGIGLVAIEEPYISKRFGDSYERLAARGFLPTEGSGPVALDPTAWWGAGSMLDFSQREAADFWHDWKRQPLMEAGIFGHWTDLGEPEAFSANALYDHGKLHHADIHNLYNFWWSESIYRGYERQNWPTRPWILSRSGTLGSQRYGVSMWSGDIGANLESLRAQGVAQSQMSLSGVDYFGSDIGGFHREHLRSNLDELYTQWLAAGALFDVPVRAHTLNLCNCQETAPDRIGDRASNLANLRTRYALLPYYYSLSFAAHVNGDPVAAPLVYYFQDDLQTRDLGLEKMIGPFLLGQMVAQADALTTSIYLPRGEWFDFRLHEHYSSEGEWKKAYSLKPQGLFQLPLLAREGALIPMAELDAQSAPRPDLKVRVYPSAMATHFTLFEDDGRSASYKQGAFRLTDLQQKAEDKRLRIQIGAARGNFVGAPRQRPEELEVVSLEKIRLVQVNGRSLARLSNFMQAEQNLEGWAQAGNLIRVNLGSVPAEVAQKIDLVY